MDERIARASENNPHTSRLSYKSHGLSAAIRSLVTLALILAALLISRPTLAADLYQAGNDGETPPAETPAAQ